MNKRMNTLIFTVALLCLAALQTTISAQGPSDLNSELARARAATAKYHDIFTALEDGFTQVPLSTCHGDANGAVGISYVNIPRFVNQAVNSEEPEFLNYIPTSDGNVRLVSVAYGSPARFRDTRSPDTPGYRPGSFPWLNPVIPSYLEEVSGSFTVFGQQPPRVFEGRWLYLLTAHIWAPNPLGMFADGNPNLSCPE